MTWTDEDKQKMDAASNLADEDLTNILDAMDGTLELKGAHVIIKWFAKYYMTAGYKRLGRTIVEEAKAIVDGS